MSNGLLNKIFTNQKFIKIFFHLNFLTYSLNFLLLIFFIPIFIKSENYFLVGIAFLSFIEIFQVLTYIKNLKNKFNINQDPLPVFINRTKNISIFFKKFSQKFHNQRYNIYPNKYQATNNLFLPLSFYIIGMFFILSTFSNVFFSLMFYLKFIHVAFEFLILNFFFVLIFSYFYKSHINLLIIKYMTYNLKTQTILTTHLYREFVNKKRYEIRALNVVVDTNIDKEIYKDNSIIITNERFYKKINKKKMTFTQYILVMFGITLSILLGFILLVAFMFYTFLRMFNS